MDADNSDASPVEPVDAMDANTSDADTSEIDTFQVLSGCDALLMMTNSGEIAVGGLSDIPEDLAEQSIEFESHFSDTSTVVVDHFPFGNPGASIPGATQGQSSYDCF